jgi:hypothetical protein
MSLDIYLKDPDCEYVYEATTTQDLNRMTSDAGIYQRVWSPVETEITKVLLCAVQCPWRLGTIRRLPSEDRKVETYTVDPEAYIEISRQEPTC